MKSLRPGIKPYNALVTLAGLPAKWALGRDTTQQRIWMNMYLGREQTFESDGCKWLACGRLRGDEPGWSSYDVSKLNGMESFAPEGEWGKEVISHFSPGKVLVDVGANIGAYAIRAAKQGMSVYAFEPSPANRAFLRRNFDLNPGVERNITVVEDALGDADATGTLSDDGLSSRLESADGYTVSIRTLDSFKLPQIDLMKVDVEGYELNVLSGAKETLRMLRPTILLELHSTLGEQKTKDLFEFVGNLGYSDRSFEDRRFWRGVSFEHHLLTPKGS